MSAASQNEDEEKDASKRGRFYRQSYPEADVAQKALARKKATPDPTATILSGDFYDEANSAPPTPPRQQQPLTPLIQEPGKWRRTIFTTHQHQKTNMPDSCSTSPAQQKKPCKPKFTRPGNDDTRLEDDGRQERIGNLVGHCGTSLRGEDEDKHLRPGDYIRFVNPWGVSGRPEDLVTARIVKIKPRDPHLGSIELGEYNPTQFVPIVLEDEQEVWRVGKTVNGEFQRPDNARNRPISEYELHQGELSSSSSNDKFTKMILVGRNMYKESEKKLNHAVQEVYQNKDHIGSPPSRGRARKQPSTHMGTGGMAPKPIQPCGSNKVAEESPYKKIRLDAGQKAAPPVIDLTSDTDDDV